MFLIWGSSLTFTWGTSQSLCRFLVILCPAAQRFTFQISQGAFFTLGNEARKHPLGSNWFMPSVVQQSRNSQACLLCFECSAAYFYTCSCAGALCERQWIFKKYTLFSCEHKFGIILAVLLHLFVIVIRVFVTLFDHSGHLGCVCGHFVFV